MEKQSKYLFISNFILKVIAIVLMTLDHVGIFLENLQNTQQIGTIFRYFGRLAFPLFILIVVEGVRHTKHFGKYFLKLSILTVIFMVGQIIYFYLINNKINSFYSPILDITLLALMLYLLKRKDKFSFLAILPIIFITLSFIVINIEKSQNINVIWLPFFLRVPYALFDIILALIFFYSDKLGQIFLKGNSSTENLVGTAYEQVASNAINSLGILLFTFIFYLIYKGTGASYMFADYQSYAAISCLIVLFYNGKRGYDKPWFKYGAYVYLPLHIGILALIFALL